MQICADSPDEFTRVFEFPPVAVCHDRATKSAQMQQTDEALASTVLESTTAETDVFAVYDVDLDAWNGE